MRISSYNEKNYVAIVDDKVVGVSDGVVGVCLSPFRAKEAMLHPSFVPFNTSLPLPGRRLTNPTTLGMFGGIILQQSTAILDNSAQLIMVNNMLIMAVVKDWK